LHLVGIIDRLVGLLISLCLRSSLVWEYCAAFTDVSGQLIGPIVKGTQYSEARRAKT